MAQGVSRIQLLQVCGCGHHECSVSCSDQLLPPTWPEHVGSLNDGPNIAATNSARTGQRLHSFQDSDDDAQPIHWQYWRARGGPGLSDDGNTGSDVNRNTGTRTK